MSTGVDRELLAVLVALEPLDDRKWDYLRLSERTFHPDHMLQEPRSSRERVLINDAASLWDTGTVDLATSPAPWVDDTFEPSSTSLPFLPAASSSATRTRPSHPSAPHSARASTKETGVTANPSCEPRNQ